MGTHEDEPTGAEYFTLAAGVALDDVRDPVEGFDAAGLEELRAAAVSFLASLPVAAPVTHSPIRWHDDHGTLVASDVSPLPTVVQWATS